MNRIILIGNGFDLAHGLPTKYEDFINWYHDGWLNKLRKSDKSVESDDLCKFTLKYSDTWKNYWYNKVSPLSNSSRLTGKKFMEYIKKYPNIHVVEECLFLKEICKSIKEKNWVDIENEYYKFLSSFLTRPKYKNPECLNKDLDAIKSRLITYLNSIQKNQIQYLHLNKQIKEKILSPLENTDISTQEVWTDFIERRKILPREEWKKLLESYGRDDISFRLDKIEAFQKYCINEDKVKKAMAVKEKILKDFLLPDKIMLLNFNYTNTADAYLPKADCFTVNHIHGELSEPESVIFGYGDELNESYKELLKLEENEYLRNIKSIRYMETNNYREMFHFIESDSYQVCIMGHSCGNSDRTLLNTLFEHKNCVSIKPFYYRKKDGSDNYLEIVQNICRNFTDMKLIRDRVVNKTLCVPFSFQM